MSSAVEVIARPKSATGLFRRPLLFGGLLALALYAGLTAYSSGHQYMPFDVSVERSVQSVSSAPATQIFLAFDWLDGIRQDIGGVAVVLLLIAVNWRSAALVVTAAAGTTLVYYLTEQALKRPRPTPGLVHVVRHTGDYSFPSGHVAFFSWSLVLLVVCLAVGRLSRPLVVTAWVVAALVLLAVCIGRIYLGEHWPSDVIAGLALGLGWTALALSFKPLSKPVLER